MKKLFFVVLACLASACVPPAPIVAEYNGASVTIVTSQFAGAGAAEAAQAEATRICRTGGATRAEYASTRPNAQTYENFNLYLCL
ncbi:hypothetical protein HKCCE4037_06570 [Rhodobacterales bacterium HKCCE4037]|nr:hypothetical protein [Rhodobacterales bacterium HKCCE4037]